MKKVLTGILAFVLMTSFCGCSAEEVEKYIDDKAEEIQRDVEENKDKVYSVKDWKIVEDTSKENLVLSFALVNKFSIQITSDVNVDIRIVNDDGQEVYRSTVAVSADNFRRHINSDRPDTYSTDVMIPVKDVAYGTTRSGVVYFRIYSDSVTDLEELSCDAKNILPGDDKAELLEKQLMDKQQKIIDDYNALSEEYSKSREEMDRKAEEVEKQAENANSDFNKFYEDAVNNQKKMMEDFEHMKSNIETEKQQEISEN